MLTAALATNTQATRGILHMLTGDLVSYMRGRKEIFDAISVRRLLRGLHHCLLSARHLVNRAFSHGYIEGDGINGQCEVGLPARLCSTASVLPFLHLVFCLVISPQ